MQMKEKEDFMRLAISLSEDNIKQGTGGPFGAVIVKDGVIVSATANRVIPENDPTAHAEVAAIRLACKELNTYNLSGCEIYTSCEPCPMCLGAIYWARLDKIYYANTRKDAAAIGFDDDHIYEEIGCEMGDRKIPIIPMLREEALAAFNLWQTSNTSEQNY